MDIALATPEKANSVFNRLIEECNYDDISFVIIDEFHLVSESRRGQQLEALVAKLLTIELIYHKRIQIVAMTATLNHIEVYQRWLHAKVYENSLRPIPLSEYIVAENQLFSTSMEPLASLPKSLLTSKTTLAYLINLYRSRMQSVLVFCPTKLSCEKTAAKLAVQLARMSPVSLPSDCPLERAVNDGGANSVSPHPAGQYERREEVIAQLRHLPCGLCPILAETLRLGIAYHHSGLTGEERKIIESAYRRGVVTVIVATSTLSTGINLPAKTVIFQSPYVDSNNHNQD